MPESRRLEITNIARIQRSTQGSGYEIVFNDDRTIWVTKARAVVALLVLIYKREGAESDLAQGSTTLPELKALLKGKCPENLIRDAYGDANKPFSELWNEEGFVWIHQPSGKRLGRSQAYVLNLEDHDKFFGPVKKAHRKAPSHADLSKLTQRLQDLCNLCGSRIVADRNIPQHAFSRDRLRQRIDHRRPVEKGGASDDPTNFQLLCFYCNKSKWQICNICPDPQCDKCVLAFPENNTTVFPTQENIGDRIRS